MTVTNEIANSNSKDSNNKVLITGTWKRGNDNQPAGMVQWHQHWSQPCSSKLTKYVGKLLKKVKLS